MIKDILKRWHKGSTPADTQKFVYPGNMCHVYFCKKNGIFLIIAPAHNGDILDTTTADAIIHYPPSAYARAQYLRAADNKINLSITLINGATEIYSDAVSLTPRPLASSTGVVWGVTFKKVRGMMHARDIVAFSTQQKL